MAIRVEVGMPFGSIPNGSRSFETLVVSIRNVHGTLSAQASRAVNVSLTARNWLIGCYIAEYELHGADRASYGDSLLWETGGCRRVETRFFCVPTGEYP